MAAHVATTNIWNTTAGDKALAFTPAVGELIVLVVANTGNTNSLSESNVTDNQGGTYAAIDFYLKNASADRMYIMVRNQLVSSAVSHTVTVDLGTTTTGGGIAVIRVSGMSRVGTNAVRQEQGQDNAAAGTPAPVFPSAPLTANMVIGAIFNGTNPATMTPRTNFTERADLGYNTPATGLHVMTRDSGETATTQTWGSASGSAFASMVIELDTSVPVVPNLLPRRRRPAHRFLTMR